MEYFEFLKIYDYAYITSHFVYLVEICHLFFLIPILNIDDLSSLKNAVKPPY